ncbi:hypothetical protein BASA81_000661 [Batrachochytrium salamandrivorans]|nr:hypothetical protein BASA81_000661 [Batrachochytrium salamandrivorans]
MHFVALFLAVALHATTLIAQQQQHKRLAGYSYSFCHLQLDGQVYCAGYNNYGMLSVGSSTGSFATPLKMLTVINATDVSMGDTHSCLVDQGGRVRCAGYNSYYYALGDGTTSNRNVLGNVLGLESGVAQVFSSNLANCVVMETTGAAWCWGSNMYGMLGDGTTTTPTQAVQVKGFETGGAAFVALGDYHTCFLSTLGQLLCTGENANGQLGVGTLVDATRPSPVLGLGETLTFTTVACVWTSDASFVLTNKANSYILLSNGSALAFGQNMYGELGNGGRSDYSSAAYVRVPKLFSSGQGNIREIRGGFYATCVMLMDDSIKCVGENGYGQFGGGSAMGSGSFYALVDRLSVAQLPPTVPATMVPTRSPTLLPTTQPSRSPTMPTPQPTKSPTKAPTMPTMLPTRLPTKSPTSRPTRSPTLPTPQPTKSPTKAPTMPTMLPTRLPTKSPTSRPTRSPTLPTSQPTKSPTRSPTMPTMQPTRPTRLPTSEPTPQPTRLPTLEPTTSAPTLEPTLAPSFPPGVTGEPTTLKPTLEPTTLQPTLQPTSEPTLAPSFPPGVTGEPTLSPVVLTTNTPTLPTTKPTRRPTMSGDMRVDGGGAMATSSAAAVLLLLAMTLF